MMQKEYQFPCEKCGAKLHFSAGEGELECSYCSHINKIERAFEQILEKDYEATIAKLKAEKEKSVEVTSTKCNACGAVFELSENIHASSCPYCSSPIVNETAFYRPIKPQALLPFKIEEKDARKLFKVWLDGRWFAPNNLKKYASKDGKLKAIYVPYWTYDSDTYSNYIGRRGDKYYEEESYTETVNAQSMTKTRRVEKIRWHDVSGDLKKHFNDVLVMATASLKHSLSPWDLENLVDYDASYLSGYESEIYSLELDEGLISAKSNMDFFIRSAIKSQIGGDVQEIEYLVTDYSNITYKHILLPVYASAFKFEGKTYSYVINARNGDISGDRPYSKMKIALSVAGVALLIGILYYFLRGS